MIIPAGDTQREDAGQEAPRSRPTCITDLRGCDPKEKRR
jgi:hypothetical protein